MRTGGQAQMGQGTGVFVSQAATVVTTVVARASAVVVACGLVIGTASAAPAAAEDMPPPDTISAAPAGLSPSAPLAGARVPTLKADGLAESAHSRYEYDADSKTVKATVRTTIRNVQPDRGNMYYYFDSYGIPVPTGAKDIRATSGGHSYTIRSEPTEDEFTTWAVVSFSDLLHGQSRTIDWSYTIPGDPLRSDSYTRVGKGYATFATQAIGDEGSVSVEVVAPKTMEFNDYFGGFTEKTADGKKTWSTSAVTDEYGIWSLVSLRDPDQADTTKVDIGDEELTLLSFPDDKKWSKFVKERLTEGLPVVEEMVGQEWPGGLQEIREDVSPEVLGFAWFDGQREEIVIGEDLDEQLFYHELTHTWVNDGALEGRWLIEGITETIARRVVEQTGGTAERPTASRDDKGSLALSTWKHLAQDFSDADESTEEYAYAAAPATIEKLVADLDDEEFTELVAALLEGQSSYEEPGATHIGDKPDWRRLLDLLEDRSGVEGAEKELATWVLTDKQKKELPKRAEERERYFALDEADGDWVPPQGVRIRMTEWEFDQAAEAREAIGADTPAAARRVQDAAAAAGIPAPTAVRETYEKASTGHDYDELVDLMPRAADVTEQVSEVVQDIGAESDPFTELGETILLADDAVDHTVQKLDDGELDAAAEDAERAARLADLAVWVGILLILLVLGVVALVVWLVIRVRRRRAAAALALRDLPEAPDDASQLDELSMLSEEDRAGAPPAEAGDAEQAESAVQAGSGSDAAAPTDAQPERTHGE